MMVENLPRRDTISRIGTTPFLRDFVRLGPRAVMDFTFLDRCFNAIVPETWQQMNKEIFGTYPEAMAGDKGMGPRAEKRAALEAKVKVLAIPRRLKDWGDEAMVEWQGFRAGIKGTISVLKRAFRLARCLFRGFRHFASAVGLSVVCHNLVVLAAHGTG